MREDCKQDDAGTEVPTDAPLNGRRFGRGRRKRHSGSGCAALSPGYAVVPEAVSETSEADQVAAAAAVSRDLLCLRSSSKRSKKRSRNSTTELLRKQAEFDNFRKRTEREKIESYDFALANFIVGLLPALDGLERGLSVTEGETVESYKKGIELILKQLRDQLASAGVQPIRATGKMFDPNFHQAVMREESAVLPENEIIEEMQRGYTFKDRLLRPSMVKVAVAPAEGEVEEPAAPAEAAGNEAETVDRD